MYVVQTRCFKNGWPAYRRPFACEINQSSLPAFFVSIVDFKRYCRKTNNDYSIKIKFYTDFWNLAQKIEGKFYEIFLRLKYLNDSF